MTGIADPFAWIGHELQTPIRYIYVVLHHTNTKFGMHPSGTHMKGHIKLILNRVDNSRYIFQQGNQTY